MLSSIYYELASNLYVKKDYNRSMEYYRLANKKGHLKANDAIQMLFQCVDYSNKYVVIDLLSFDIAETSLKNGKIDDAFDKFVSILNNGDRHAIIFLDAITKFNKK